MKCPNCGKENKNDAKFCEECGEKLEPKEKNNTICSNCGKKNKIGVKFCEDCGTKLDEEEKVKKENKIISKIKSLPKKTKIVLGIVIVLLIVLIAVILIIFNDPSRKVSNYLSQYYDYYVEDDTTYLDKINKVYVNNKNNENTLEEIRQVIKDTIENWIEDYNIQYEDTDALESETSKLAYIFYNLYDYYDGDLLTYDECEEYSDELSRLYSSKENYLKGYKYEISGDDTDAYYYYILVIENDCYYELAQESISKYLSDELAEYKETISSMLENVNDTNIDWLNAYLEVLDYIYNSTPQGIKTSSEYKEILENAKSKVISYTKLVAKEYANNYDYAKIISLIENVMEYFDEATQEYTELKELYDEYYELMPDSLLDQYIVDNEGSYENTSSITINDETYKNALRFTFKGETQYVIYRLNGEYTKFKTTIVRGENWDKSYTGYFVIYADDTEVYRSSEITKTNDVSLDIDLDVTGVDDLKIEFVTSSGDSSYWTDKFYIYFVEPYLYK